MRHVRMDPVRERFVHLIYLAILFMQPALGDGEPWHWWLAIALAAGFAVFYLSVRTLSVWQAWLIILIGAAASFFNPGASVFFVYGAFLLGSLYTSRELWRNLALLLAIVAAQAVMLYFIYGGIFAIFSHAISAAMVIFAGVVSIGEFERNEATRRLRQANEQIATVSKIAERERIARDMHDVLGHTLSVVVLKSELANRLMATDPERAASEIADVEQLARRALKDVRTSISGYRERGFQGELANVRLALEAADVTLLEDIQQVSFTPETEPVMSLVLREAVTNVLRHSTAANSVVRLSETDDVLTLEVSDDGTTGSIIEGEGLRGMRERLQALGGHLEIDSGQGMRLIASLPAGAG